MCLPTHLGVKQAHHDEGPLPAWGFHFQIFASSLNLYPFADLCEAVNQTLGEMSSPAPSVPWRSGGAAFHDPVPQVQHRRCHSEFSSRPWAATHWRFQGSHIHLGADLSRGSPRTSRRSEPEGSLDGGRSKTNWVCLF